MMRALVCAIVLVGVRGNALWMEEMLVHSFTFSLVWWARPR